MKSNSELSEHKGCDLSFAKTLRVKAYSQLVAGATLIALSGGAAAAAPLDLAGLLYSYSPQLIAARWAIIAIFALSGLVFVGKAIFTLIKGANNPQQEPDSAKKVIIQLLGGGALLVVAIITGIMAGTMSSDTSLTENAQKEDAFKAPGS